MSLHVKAEKVRMNYLERTGNTGVGQAEIQLVHGKDCNLMVGWRKPGYHSTPHIHDCEQLNYVAEGECWFFVEDKAFLLKPGDFHRVPRNKPHWLWNKTDKPVLLIEAHSPPLLPTELGLAIGLFDDGESNQVSQATHPSFVDYDYATVERKVFGAKSG